MNALLNPKWLLLVNTLPLLILAFLLNNQFKLIGSLLKPDEIHIWTSMAVLMMALGSLTIISGIYYHVKRQGLTLGYALITLISYISFLYYYSMNLSRLIPFHIPDWMLMDEISLYLGSFLMPTMAHALFVIVARLTHEINDVSAIKNFLMALSIPFSWYLFLQLALPLWKLGSGEFISHLYAVLLISSTVVFLFFLLRCIYVITNRQSEFWSNNQLLYKVPFSLILPFAGLALSNGDLGTRMGPLHPFGNFSNVWFYILAGLNGVLLCLPELTKRTYRLALFFARSCTFSYTLYFLIVFIPYLPLSIIAILAIGLGFLLLAPLLLFQVHTKSLVNDLEYLKIYYSPILLKTLLVIGILIIPTIVIHAFYNHKETLDQALAYVYHTNYDKPVEINKEELKHTLSVISAYGKKHDFFFGQNHTTPYLTSLYKWVVLDNLTLSRAKQTQLQNIFFGISNDEIANTIPSRTSPKYKDIEITKITNTTEFDEENKTYRTWVNMELTNLSRRSRSEYATTITLPEGAWICDYYLYVGDRKEYGILTEKKAAIWVYANIINERKDPGILYYLGGNRIAFKVFPFNREEVRKTGFEIVHREPFTLTIDEKEVQLGNGLDDSVKNTNLSFENETALIVSTNDKQELDKTARQPYLHFFLNASNSELLETQLIRLKSLVSSKEVKLEKAKISLVNAQNSTFEYQDNWEAQLTKVDTSGGYFLDRAIKETLYRSYKAPGEGLPQFVFLSDSLESSTLSSDYGDWGFTRAEGLYYYTVNENLSITQTSLLNHYQSAVTMEEIMRPVEVLRYSVGETIHYLKNDNSPSLILKQDHFTITESSLAIKSWESALLLQAHYRSHILHPELAQKEWTTAVKNSFKSKILTPYTSYLVVENEAQKAVLLKKQKDLLSGNKALDAGEDPRNMSEPRDWLVMIILLIVVGLIQRLKENKLTTTLT